MKETARMPFGRKPNIKGKNAETGASDLRRSRCSRHNVLDALKRRLVCVGPECPPRDVTPSHGNRTPAWQTLTISQKYRCRPESTKNADTPLIPHRQADTPTRNPAFAVVGGFLQPHFLRCWKYHQQTFNTGSGELDHTAQRGAQQAPMRAILGSLDTCPQQDCPIREYPTGGNVQIRW